MNTEFFLFGSLKMYGPPIPPTLWEVLPAATLAWTVRAVKSALNLADPESVHKHVW